MAVKEQGQKTAPRTVSTRSVTIGAPQRMQKGQSLDEIAATPPTVAELQERQKKKGLKRRPALEESAPVSFEELQRRQDEFGLTRRPTKFRRATLEELDEDTIPVPDVAPTMSD